MKSLIGVGLAIVLAALLSLITDLIKAQNKPHQETVQTKVKPVSNFSEPPGFVDSKSWKNDPIIEHANPAKNTSWKDATVVDNAEEDEIARSTKKMSREMLVSVIRVQREFIMELQDHNKKLIKRLGERQSRPTVVYKQPTAVYKSDPNSRRIADALEDQNNLIRQKQEQEKWDKIFEPLPPSQYGPEWRQREEMIQLQRDQNFLLREQILNQQLNRR